ncbi:MAG TPA: hypothetical protein VGK93_04860 [Candidatus Eisenbacteria bacterium]|jgi:hypothetical protein
MDLLERITEVVRIAEQLRDVELKRKLTDVQIECVELAQENARLRAKVGQLETAATASHEMVFRDNLYWMRHSDGTEEGPFCPKCWGGDGKVVPLMHQTHWYCAVCSTGIVRSGRPEERALAPSREPIR